MCSASACAAACGANRYLGGTCAWPPVFASGNSPQRACTACRACSASGCHPPLAGSGCSQWQRSVLPPGARGPPLPQTHRRLAFFFSKSPVPVPSSVFPITILAATVSSFFSFSLSLVRLSFHVTLLIFGHFGYRHSFRDHSILSAFISKACQSFRWADSAICIEHQLCSLQGSQTTFFFSRTRLCFLFWLLLPVFAYYSQYQHHIRTLPSASCRRFSHPILLNLHTNPYFSGRF